MENTGKYSELTGRILACAIEVHKELGTGFQEVVYQRASVFADSPASGTLQLRGRHQLSIQLQ